MFFIPAAAVPVISIFSTGPTPNPVIFNSPEASSRAKFPPPFRSKSSRPRTAGAGPERSIPRKAASMAKSSLWNPMAIEPETAPP